MEYLYKKDTYWLPIGTHAYIGSLVIVMECTCSNKRERERNKFVTRQA